MRATILLADAAQAVDGKLYILGGGWSVCGPGPTPMALAVKIEVPWDQANRRHTWEFSLLGADGQEIQIPTPEGDQPVLISGEFEVGRPPGLPAGSGLDLPVAINVGALPLPPGQRYVWRLLVDREGRDEWQVSFMTRPATS